MWQALLCLCLLFFLQPFSLYARPYDDVIASGKLVVFVYDDYAPYSWYDGDELKGIDVEIGRAFGEKLGVEIEFLVRGADENIDDDLRVNIWKGDLIHRKAADVMLHVPVDKEVNIRNNLAVITSPYFLEHPEGSALYFQDQPLLSAQDGPGLTSGGRLHNGFGRLGRSS